MIARQRLTTSLTSIRVDQLKMILWLLVTGKVERSYYLSSVIIGLGITYESTRKV